MAWGGSALDPVLSLDVAVQRTMALCEATVRATRSEIRAAAVALCLAVREVHPSAEVVMLDDSDQGGWMWVEGWCESESSQVREVEEDDVWSLADHLYTPAAVEAVTGLHEVEPPRRYVGPRYVMTIDTVLRAHRSVLA